MVGPSKRLRSGSLVGSARTRGFVAPRLQRFRMMAAVRRARMTRIPGSLRSHAHEIKALVVSQATAGPGGVTLALNTTGNIIALNQIVAGASFFNRIGRKVEMKSIRFSYNIQVINSAARNINTDIGRIMIVYDRQTNGGTPALADILQDTEQSGANTTVTLSGMNLNNKERFLVIMDKRISLPAITTTNAGQVATAPFPSDTTTDFPLGDEFRKLSNLVTHYKADSSPAVVTDISTGGLFLVVFGGLAAGSEAYQIPTWNARLRFYDL